MSLEGFEIASSRIGNSIKGIIFGIVLVIGSVILLFWNEGRAVKTAKSLQEGAKAVISISAQTINPSNEGKLVHLTGFATTEDVLEDVEFGVSENAVKLKRKVEMYQWKETTESHRRKKVGGGTETTTTYEYNKTWSENLINSSNFKKSDGHQNPKQMSYKSKIYTADKVSLEEFTLSKGLLRQMNNYESLIIDESHEDNASESLVDKLKIANGKYYLGDDPDSPETGDIRITYEVAGPSTVSIVAKQSGNSFTPYMTKVGRELEMLSVGSYSAEEMFKKAETQNKIFTWVLRFVGFIVMGIGFSMIFGPLSVLADVIPLLGDLVGLGTGLISFALSVAISLITIAIGWIFYRPLLGIILIIFASLPIIWLITSAKKK